MRAGLGAGWLRAARTRSASGSASGDEVDELGVGEQLVERSVGPASSRAAASACSRSRAWRSSACEQRHAAVGHRRGEGVGVGGEQRGDVGQACRRRGATSGTRDRVVGAL